MTEQSRIPPRDISPEGPSHTRKVPPLVWVILALVIAVLAIGAVGGLNMNHTDQAKVTTTAT